MNVCIIGLGLIGGSLARDLRRSGFAGTLTGCDLNLHHRKIALQNKLVDSFLPLEEAIDQSELIVLCAPVDSNCRMIGGILDRIRGTRKVVTDMGSTKADIAGLVKFHPGRGRYVAVHPMAGTEYSGPAAACDRLFENRIAIVCDRESSDADAFKRVRQMLETLGMRLIYMDASDHVVHVAYVSHISHITSFALALSVLDKEKDQKNILSLAAGGFESTVRLAKSNADTWAPIFLHNSAPVLEVIDNYLEKINLFRQCIAENNAEGLQNLMNEANKIRKILR